MKKTLPAASRRTAQKFASIIISFLLLLVSSFSLHAQTTLAQGDLSIVGFNSNAPMKGISFVTWVNLSAGTQIRFTDNGFNNPLNSTLPGNIRWQEQLVTWTASTAIPAGTVISINDNPGTASTGTVSIINADGTSTLNWALSNGPGDEVFAFQGTYPSAANSTGNFTGTILFALGYQGQSGLNTNWLLAGPASSSYSCVPLDLFGTNEIYLSTNSTGGQYTGPRATGLSFTAYKLLIDNPANWTLSTGSTATTSYNLGTFANSIPVFTTQPVNAGLCGTGNTTFSVAAIAAASYQWQVDAGLGFVNIIDLLPYSGAGTATLTITGANALMNGYRYRCIATGAGSAISNAATLNVSVILTSWAQTNVSCNGGSNGTATVIPAGGVAPYTYSWTPSGGNGATASGLMAGAYTVDVTDNIGCHASRTYNIVQPAAMSATVSQTNVACNGGSNGSAGIIVAGGSFPYSFIWTPSGGTNNFATGLTAGAYTVLATDANGCTLSRNFTITQPTALAASTSQSNVSCYGGSNGAASVSVTGGTGGRSYVWLPGGGFGSSISGKPAGAYSVIITDDNGCSLTKNITITQPPALVTSGSQVNVACNGGSNGSATVVASGGTGSYTYGWSPAGGTAATATGLSAGIYTVTVADANGCTTTRSFIITQAPVLVASVNHTDVSCTGAFSGNASVSVIGGALPYTYSWSPSGGTGAIATGLAVGNYSVTVTDLYGCSLVKNVTIGQFTTITAAQSQVNVSCNGGSNGSATVSPNGGMAPYTYSWSPSGGTAATASGLTAGTYSVTITDAIGCSIVKSFTITHPIALLATTAETAVSICSGSTTDISFNSTTSGALFNWTAANISGDVSGFTASGGSTISQTLTGEGVVRYTITPSNGVCTGSALEVDVTVNAVTSITGNPDNKAINEFDNTSFSISAQHATAYQWQANTGSGFVNLADVAPYSGVHTATLTITSAPGSLSGNTYRCVASGACAPAVSSAATLTVAVKMPQTIAFAHTRSVVYGTPDFDAGAISSAGLQIFYSSSNEEVANIENNMVHIRKAGSTTIIAYQPGNNSYEAALPMEQVLTVTPKQLMIVINSIPAITKPYDGNTIAPLAAANYALPGVIEGDDVSVSAIANYDTKNAGNNKTITLLDFELAGESKDNYTILADTAQVLGAITKKQVAVALGNGVYLTKTYDGSAALALPAGAFDLSPFSPDSITISGVASFDTKNAGTDKVITISNVILAGYEAANYEVEVTSITTAGDITPRQLAVSMNASPLISKVYDGSNSLEIPSGNYSLDTLVNGDTVTVSAIATFDTKNAGEDKMITVYGFTLQGQDQENYILVADTTYTAGAISRKPLRASMIAEPAVIKVYDGNADAVVSGSNFQLAGVVDEDSVTLAGPSSVSYDNANADTSKLVTAYGLEIIGADAGNYVLDTSNVSSPIGIITSKEISVSANAQVKQYGHADPVLAYTVNGLAEGDILEGGLQREEGNNVGMYEIGLGTLNGGSNYTIVSFTTDSLEITPVSLVIHADSKTRRPGVVNPTFTFTYEGLVGTDPATELQTLPTANTPATTGSPIGEYPIVASGAVSPNYRISYADGTLMITPAGDEEFTVRAWSSNPDMLEIRIYSAIPQNSTIMLYTRHGQEVIVNRAGLSAGVNSFSIPVSHIAQGVYILAVRAGTHRWGNQVKIR